MSKFNIVIVNSIYDIIITGQILAHELSHAQTKSETRIDWDYQGGEPTKVREAKKVGIEVIGRGETRAGAIENGLAVMDNVDFYYQVLSKMFADEVERRKQTNLLEKIKLERVLSNLNKSVYGPVTWVEAEPFRIKGRGRKEGAPTNIRPYKSLGVSGLKSYRFIQELCRIVGYEQTKRYGASQSLSIDLVSEGRKVLDRDRFTGSHEGLKMIVKIFGGKQAKTIFRAPHDLPTFGEDANFVKAMEVIKTKEQELGLN